MGVEVPGTLEGWYVLHDFRRIDWPRWKALSASEQREIVDEAIAFFAGAEAHQDAPEGSSALFTVLGHKADLLILHLRATMDELNALELAFAHTRLADYTVSTYSYLSVTELGQYEASARGAGEDPMQSPFVIRRLKPEVPDLKYICFYPMNKLRGETVNWYTLGMDERRLLMREHGGTGRKYHNIVIQMITGSMGFDDWEWGVTLWSDDSLQIKKLVYEMRFDEVSAKYAEFGQFLFGIRLPAAELGKVFSK